MTEDKGRMKWSEGSLVDLCRKQAAFMEACGQPIGESVDLELWDKLIDEEVEEAIFEVMNTSRFSRARYVAELCDVVYVILGQINNLGAQKEFQRLFDAIHLANMSKVGPDGYVKKREDGKIIKPEGFVPVDVEKVFYEEGK